MAKPAHFLLDAPPLEGVRRFLSDRVEARLLAGGKRTIVVTVTRAGKFYDPRYGEFEITRRMLEEMIRNFDAGVYGQKIVLDVAHRPGDGAAGFFKRLFLDGPKLRGEVELTEFGVESIEKRGFIYLSAEFVENFIDNEKRQEHGPVLLGAALTTRPVIKRLDPIQLSEDALDEVPTYVSQRLQTLLSEDLKMTLKELMEKLRKKLSEFNLAEAIVTQLLNSYEAVASKLADEEMQRTLMSEFVSQGEEIAKQLSEMTGAGNGGEVVVKLDASGIEDALANSGGGMTEEQVKALMEKMRREDEERARKLAEDRQAKVDLFAKLLDEAEGLKALSEAQRKRLDEAAELITPDMTEEQVRKLAEHQIQLGNEMAVQAQLAGMGFTPTGQVHISLDESNAVRRLDEQIITGLRGTALHANGRLRLSEKVPAFVEKVLAEFDRLNAHKLHQEAKLLAGGTTSTSDTELPVGFQRTVIREALSDLRVLELVQTLTDHGATATTQIPYETRDTSAVLNDGIVYENQPIHRASVTQAMDLAYILPMKLAFLISNEVMHFSQASQINWDAYARNVESNARVMRELIVRRICNEMQRAADAYGAVAVTNEDFGTQLDGSTVSTIKTANFPIVRPHQQRDLQGNAVGSVENPITVVLNGTTLSEYDGSGNQPNGTYFRVTNYNLGYIQFVDQAGTPVTPANTGATTVSYSQATNVALFDLDNGTTDLDLHLNGLLRAIGARKALLDADRFVMPDFMLMSPVLNDTVTNARQFEAQSSKSGTGATREGDLGVVKGIGAWKTNAPGVDLGDERIIIGQTGTLTYTVAKPFMTGQPFEATDSNGRPTGQKQAYGEEYSAIKVPAPIRNRLTSVIAYSSSGR